MATKANTPEQRAKSRAFLKALWADPVWRAKTIAKRDAARVAKGPTEEQRAASRERMRRLNADPVFRAARDKTQRELNSRPEVRAAKAAQLRQRRADPECELKRLAGCSVRAPLPSMSRRELVLYRKLRNGGVERMEAIRTVQHERFIAERPFA